MAPEPDVGSAGWVSAPRGRALGGLRFAATAGLLMVSLYAAIYYPYPLESWPARVLQGYVGWVARAAAYVIGLSDPSAHMLDETTIGGRFPLRIVIDCAALDAQALYLSAVIAFPAGARAKVAGSLAGLIFVWLVNLVRLVGLYFIGIYAPERFDLMHEEVMSLLMVGSTCLAFASWLVWTNARRSPHRERAA